MCLRWTNIFFLFPSVSFSLDAVFLLTIGSFLLTMQLLYLQLTNLALLLKTGAFCLQFSFFYLQLEFFVYSGKVRLTRALRDCKQKNLTVSKKLQLSVKQFPPFSFFVAWVDVLRGLKGYCLFHHMFLNPVLVEGYGIESMPWMHRGRKVREKRPNTTNVLLLDIIPFSVVSF